MNIAIIGFGQMGQKVKEIALLRGHSVSVIVDPVSNEATNKNINDTDLGQVDIVIDFSTKDAVIDNILTSAKYDKNIIIGSTGWLDKLPEIEKLVKEKNIGALWSANFSIGVNIYCQLIAEASKLIDQYDEYDVWATELHHNNKADSPSGTAKELAKIMLENMKRKTSIIYDKLDRKIEPNEIHFSSTRGGAINFSHTIGFDSLSDTITLTHSARDRGGYALGAVKAAEWLMGKRGFYNMNDFLKS